MSGTGEMTDNPPPPGTYDGTARKTLPPGFDPFIKNPEYERYQRRASRSPDRRSRYHHDKRRYSRSRSSSYERDRERHQSRRRRDHKRTTRWRRSHSSSRSRSPNYERRAAVRPRAEHTRQRTRSKSRDSDHAQYYHRRHKDKDTDAAVDDDDEQDQPKENAFKNDGSFMAMFKKMQEAKELEERKRGNEENQESYELTAASTSGSNVMLPLRGFAGIGKRRGGRVLKTGIVAKAKVEEDAAGDEPQDAWSIYLKEVKRYKEACCDDDSKTRPLVK